MGFYELGKEDRVKLAEEIREAVRRALKENIPAAIRIYFSDEDTYIRKTAYLAIGKIWSSGVELRKEILEMLEVFASDTDPKVRQTAINAAGEIGMTAFTEVQNFFDRGLFDPHHSVRNAVIGSVKKMGEKNPLPVLTWARIYLHHEDKEIRREICHGIELRGRTHPADILPLLNELQFDKTARVRNTLVHVLGQISYKKGCLPVVIKELNLWKNKELVQKAIEEIIDVHERYKDFAVMTQQEAIDYIDLHYKK